LRLHLNALADRGLIIKEKMPEKGRGRPRFTYSMPRGPRRQASNILLDPAEAVTLTFLKLRRLCRLQRGGRCRETKKVCEAQNYPQIQKNG